MKVFPVVAGSSGPLVAAAALLVLAGCASNAHRAEGSSAATSDIVPSTALAADSPMAGATVVQSADLTLKATQEGFHTEVRNGQLLYCWTDQSLGTRIPTRKCLNAVQLKLRLQREERQRQQMQHSLAGPACPAGIACQ